MGQQCKGLGRRLPTLLPAIAGLSAATSTPRAGAAADRDAVEMMAVAPAARIAGVVLLSAVAARLCTTQASR